MVCLLSLTGLYNYSWDTPTGLPVLNYNVVLPYPTYLETHQPSLGYRCDEGITDPTDPRSKGCKPQSGTSNLAMRAVPHYVLWVEWLSMLSIEPRLKAHVPPKLMQFHCVCVFLTANRSLSHNASKTGLAITQLPC